MKYLKIKIAAIAICILHITFLQAQVKELKIGDKCPDFTFNNIINSTVSATKLSDYKGKWVIIDFWATWCSVCISALPKYDLLQKKYSNKLVILPVSRQKKVIVNSFISSNNTVKGIGMPIITEDNLLSQYFPHRTVPHVVWIDGEGIVRAITGVDEVTEANLEKLFTVTTTRLKLKEDIIGKDKMKPLLSGGLGDNYRLDSKLITFQSLLTSFVDGLSSSYSGFLYTDGMIKQIFTNCGITTLYNIVVDLSGDKRLNYRYQGDYSERLPSRIHLEVKDSTLFYWPGRGGTSWINVPQEKRVFCYEQYLPLKDSTNAKQYALEDLNRYFGSLLNIKASVAKRKVKCWVLVKTDNTSLLTSQGGKPLQDWGKNNDYVKVHNTPFKLILRRLLMSPLNQSPLPIINETGLGDQSVDLEVYANLKDPSSIGKALHKYGLDFVLAERDLDMIVIRDTN